MFSCWFFVCGGLRLQRSEKCFLIPALLVAMALSGHAQLTGLAVTPTFSITTLPAIPKVGDQMAINATVNSVGGIIPTGGLRLRINHQLLSGQTAFTPINASGQASFLFTSAATGVLAFSLDYLSGDSNYASVGDVGATNVEVGPATPSPLRFVPVTPCRVADTRNPAGPFGGPAISGGLARDFVIPNSNCGVPATAQAYSLNVAVVPTSGSLGFLTLWPSGQPQPPTSSLNSVDGRTKSSAVIVLAGIGGAVSVFASNPTQVVLDVNGYFVPATAPNGLAFYPITPCRITDTRTAVGPLGGPSLNGGGQGRTFPIPSAAGCNIPLGAQAYSLNFTAIPKGPLGFLTAWPTGQPLPLVASLNSLTGTPASNAAIVPAGTGGAIDVFASNPTDLIIDIDGYFAPAAPGGLSLYKVTPCRALDTRLPAGALPISGRLDVPIAAGACGVPVAAQSIVMCATVVPPAPLGFLVLWAQGQNQPNVATLVALDGVVTSNLAIVPTTSGTISAFPSNPTHLVLDVLGYFAP
jgi:hypothetical protein